MIVPANVTFKLVVSTSPEKRRTFNLNLNEGETRVLVVDLENMGAVAAAPPKAQEKPPEAEAAPAAEGSAETLSGFLTSVYFRPPTGGTGEASDRAPTMATPSIAPAPGVPK